MSGRGNGECTGLEVVMNLGSQKGGRVARVEGAGRVVGRAEQ